MSMERARLEMTLEPFGNYCAPQAAHAHGRTADWYGDHHCIIHIIMTWWTGLAPWEFEFPFQEALHLPACASTQAACAMARAARLAGAWG